MKCIDVEDLLPIIQDGTAKWLGETKEKLIKP